MGKLSFLLTVVEDESAETTARVLGMDEDGADFCGVRGGIEERSFAAGAVVAAEESAPIAPAAAAGDEAGSLKRLSDEVGAVFNELGVETERVTECAFNLRGSVVVLLQLADGLLNQQTQGGDVSGCGDADSIVRR